MKNTKVLRNNAFRRDKKTTKKKIVVLSFYPGHRKYVVLLSSCFLLLHICSFNFRYFPSLSQCPSGRTLYWKYFVFKRFSVVRWFFLYSLPSSLLTCSALFALRWELASAHGAMITKVDPSCERHVFVWNTWAEEECI